MSKGLEALEKIDHTICMNNLANNIKWDIDKYDHCACVSVEDFVECYEIIDKELKALEIIKEKKANIGYFIRFYKDKSYNEYLADTQFTIGKQISEIPLTQEEYDLVKEIVDNE